MNAPRTYRVGEFTVVVTDRQLFRDGREVFLRPKAFDTLLCLVEGGGRLVTKDDLLQRVWPGTYVSDAVLTHCISEVRQALADDPRQPRYVRTVSKRGYKLVAAVDAVGGSEPPVTTPREPPGRAIAVLPFANLSRDPENEHLCDGLSEELINGLTKVPPLRVVAHTSSFAFKGRDVDAREIGRTLDVSAILEGSVRRAGSRLRVSAQLIDAASGYHLWSDQYDRGVGDVFAIQEEIAQAILRALRIELLEARSAPVVKPLTASLTAHDLYLQGRSYWHRRYAGFMQRAIESFERAIAVDPGFALAHCGLADCYGSLGVWGFAPPHSVFPRARDLAQRALALDPDLAEAHASRALVQTFYEWDWDGAEQGFRRALDLNPGVALIRLWNGHLLSIVGRMPEALREVFRAQSLDPLSPVVNANVGWTLALAGESERAMSELQRAVSLDPLNAMAYFYIGFLHGAAGRWAEAIPAFQRSLEIAPAFPGIREAIAAARADMGDPAPAREWLDRTEASREPGYVMSSMVARVLLSVGRRDEALARLERALEEHDPMMVWLPFLPAFEVIRSTARFTKILAAMHLGRPACA